MRQVLLHETMHVLGFTREKLAQFPCPSAPSFNRETATRASPRACSDVGSTEPVVAVNGTGGRTLRRLATPAVLAAARRHYNCTGASGDATLIWMPLEDCLGGNQCLEGRGTESSHWEMRAMAGDLMVATAGSGARSAVSAMTLAVFEDSGWFAPNYAVPSPRCFFDPAWCAATAGSGTADSAGTADTGTGTAGTGTAGDGTTMAAAADGAFLWGRGRGCDFVSSACDGAAWRARGYWCAADPSATFEEQSAAVNAEGCTLGRIAVGHCSLTLHTSPVPPPFQYIDADPRFGGGAYEDYCPIMHAYSNGDCRVPTATSLSRDAPRGEARCDHCRCFESSLVNATTLVSAPYHGCYEHRCLSATQLQLRIAGVPIWLDCNANANELRLLGWSGVLRCPPASELCARATDLAWPQIDMSSIRPQSGPAAGGTPLTIRGWHLIGAVPSTLNASAVNATDADAAIDAVASAALPRVWICNVPAVVRVPTASEAAAAVRASSDEAQRTAAPAMVARGDVRDTIIAITAALPPSPQPISSTNSLNVACNLRLEDVQARVAVVLDAYSYQREPRMCRVFDIAEFDWSDRGHLISLYVCLSPIILTALVSLYLLRMGCSLRRRLRVLHKLKWRFRSEISPRQAPL